MIGQYASLCLLVAIAQAAFEVLTLNFVEAVLESEGGLSLPENVREAVRMLKASRILMLLISETEAHSAAA